MRIGGGESPINRQGHVRDRQLASVTRSVIRNRGSAANAGNRSPSDQPEYWLSVVPVYVSVFGCYDPMARRAMALCFGSTGPRAKRLLAGLPAASVMVTVVAPVMVAGNLDVIGDVLHDIGRADRPNHPDSVNRVFPWRKRGQHEVHPIRHRRINGHSPGDARFTEDSRKHVASLGRGVAEGRRHHIIDRIGRVVQTGDRDPINRASPI